MKFCHKVSVMADIVVFSGKKSLIPEFVKKVPVFCEFVE